MRSTSGIAACPLCRLPARDAVQACACGVRAHAACVAEFALRACPTLGCDARPTPLPLPTRPRGAGLLLRPRNVVPVLLTLVGGLATLSYEVDYLVHMQRVGGTPPAPGAFAERVIACTLLALVGWIGVAFNASLRRRSLARAVTSTLLVLLALFAHALLIRLLVEIGAFG